MGRESTFREEDEDSVLVSDDVKAVASFDSMNLKEDLLRGIFAYGKPNLIYVCLF